ncbi:MAG TPA: GDSL-type esterase/lipase family protein [Candidatus Saccharimonadales bacterium]|nr:GDSL-type esterase/lipase family protein [Candidatus Saccharimonadales bacterium]
MPHHRRPSRIASVVALTLCLAVAIPLASIEIALLIAPAQSVDAAGQSLALSAGPSASTSGPGSLELFGRSIPTTQQFSGPIRPRLLWAEVTHYDELLLALKQPEHLGQDLRNGWSAYFARELVIAVIVAAVLAALGLALLRRRWQVIVAGMAVAAVVAGGADALAISSAAQSLQNLSQVRTLDELVGRAPLAVDPPSHRAPAAIASTVVIGDSTAAGAGNPPVATATAEDTACRRSRDSYAADIAAVNNTTVVNLACTNASIEAGLFGPEAINGTVVPSQLARLEAMHGVTTVIVSIGANEMHWTQLMELCLMAPRCDDSASAAWFSQALDSFTIDYYDLLQRLAALQGLPRVIVNEYYDPLPVKPVCPSQPAITGAKSAVLLSRLTTFNTVLADGAASFGFDAVAPNFLGHELCTAQPFVQGPEDAAPLHPTAAGEIAIALADEQALLNPPPPRPTGAATPSPS